MKAIHTVNTFHYILSKSSKWKRKCLSLSSSNSLSFKQWPAKTFTIKGVCAPTGIIGALALQHLAMCIFSKLNKPGLILLPRVWVTLSLYPKKRCLYSYLLLGNCPFPASSLKSTVHWMGLWGKTEEIREQMGWMSRSQGWNSCLSLVSLLLIDICSFMLSDKKYGLRRRWGHCCLKSGSQVDQRERQRWWKGYRHILNTTCFSGS